MAQPFPQLNRRPLPPNTGIVMLKKAKARTLRARLLWLAEKRHHPVAIAAMAILMVLLISATAFRIHADYAPPPINNEFDWENRGHSDFHNGSYYPAQCFMNGACPYLTEDSAQYLMTRAAATYSPIVFAIHIPFAMLPLEMADIAFFACNVAMMMLLAYFSIRMSGAPFYWFDFLAITNLILMSRPGHMTMFTGYFTAEIVIGCIVALHFAHSRPKLSGLGMVLASIKPNFVIPLIIMMLWRRNYRAVFFGILFSAIAAVAGLGWLSYHNGMGQVIQDVRGGQAELHVDETEIPINTWTRTDLLGMYAKVVNSVPSDTMYLISMVVLSLVIGPIIYRFTPHESNRGATGLTAFVSVLAILVGIYHHSYDCLLMVVPAIGVLCYGSLTLKEVPVFWRNVVALMCVVPAINYVSTLSVMNLLGLERHSFSWQTVTMINGICLTVALVVLVAMMIRNLVYAKTSEPSAAA